MNAFIDKYTACDVDALSLFAKGLFKDIDAVKNSLIYNDISNGPSEGMNNKIKMIKRRSYGRAGTILLNAYLLLDSA